MVAGGFAIHSPNWFRFLAKIRLFWNFGGNSEVTLKLTTYGSYSVMIES
ncbi:12233_t:CDS:2 [Acaulospora morrowiae]|uniref:12233_t:CDS:1 n=1 Tax=Acaulospora morrowiae TaxID=94023 RepID=A0A9N9FSJ7_9GLOM|nr:12233_t:CDS:2 [Acaulospora morrowiae]